MGTGKASKITLSPTDRSLPIALLRARETVMEPVRDMLAKSGISEQKWRILRVVDELGPVEQTGIARAACLLLPSLTRIINAMEKDGLLARMPDSDDRRKSMVSITQEGRALIEEHSAQSRDIFQKIEARFGKEKLDHLLDLLDELQKIR